MIRPTSLAGLLGLLLMMMCGLRTMAADPARPVSFNRDVRPILSDHCFHCHGPDKNQRKADLRLDRADGGALGTDGAPGVVVPGKPEASELIRRLVTADNDERMPPADSGRQLTAAQIETLRRWVAEGAAFELHWSLLPPARAKLPEVRRPEWSRARLDHFVLARLDRENLAPAPDAKRSTLLRRATFDLTGIPPTPDEIDAFDQDDSPDAYERQLDRLLASPRYGERWGARWLDAARYADTSGYQSDGPRSMWRWRDWVLESLNHGMPFDQFTIEQLAGDLLPSPTLEQRIATGFNRNHRGNSEGGIIPEEYAVEYVVDRVDTTATVWLGLTLGCARCHEHKFDPISQREYYQLFALFNNVPEFGRAIKEGNSPPFIAAPTRLESERLARLDADIQRCEETLRGLNAAIDSAERAWSATVAAAALAESNDGRPGELARRADHWTIADGLAARFALDDLAIQLLDRTPSPMPFTVAGQPATPAAETLTAIETVRSEPGVSGTAVAFDGSQSLEAAGVGDFHYFDPFSICIWMKPTGAEGGTLVSRMSDVPRGDGYAVRLVDGRLQLLFVKRWHDDALRLESEEQFAPDRWRHVAVVYDGSRNAGGVALYVDGERKPLRVQLDLLNQTFQVKEPLRIGWGGGPNSGFHGLLDDARIYRRAITAAEARILAVAAPISAIAQQDATERSPAAREKLRACFLESFAPDEQRRAYRELRDARRRRAEFANSVSTVMVMEEMSPPRATRVLRRGEYDKPGDVVEPGVPSAFPPLESTGPANRLSLARWLVDRRHPLTARVAVNRAWQAVFGLGLVRTTEDFGSQGQAPTHPELLDDLAVEFQSGSSTGDADADRAVAWDLKRLCRRLLTSSAYRQDSRVAPELAERDPDNVLLARGPRFRLPAEMIRDQALAASGLLVERLGGPSVKPYQPADLWKELATDTNYNQGHGADLYRRTLYTFWKRTVAPPTLVTFDAAAREACVVRDNRTNTPLQALTLLNEVTFVEAARVLAERAYREGGSTPATRIERAFRLVLGRAPRPAELEVLLAGWQAHRDRYARDADAAERLVSVGEWPRAADIDSRELAPYVATASVLLNLDEAVTKE